MLVSAIAGSVNSGNKLGGVWRQGQIWHCGKFMQKNLSAGPPYTHHLCTGPTRGYPHPPLRMLTILDLMISTLTISTLTIPAPPVRTHIISTLTISTLRMRPSERSLT